MPEISEGSNVFFAQMTSGGKTSASFQAKWTSTSASFTRYRYVWLEIDGRSFEIRSNELGGANSTFNKTITGLDPGMTYYWEATLGWAELEGDITYSSWAVVGGSFTTSPAIDPWSWSKSNGSATDTQTANAYSLLVGKRLVDYGFPYKVWNDLVDKIMDMRELADAAGQWMTDGGRYRTYDQCKVMSGDTLSAAIYNSVKVQVGSIKSTGIYDVSPGDKLTGSHITTLASVLNEIIADL